MPTNAIVNSIQSIIHGNYEDRKKALKVLQESTITASDVDMLICELKVIRNLKVIRDLKDNPEISQLFDSILSSPQGNLTAIQRQSIKECLVLEFFIELSKTD